MAAIDEGPDNSGVNDNEILFEKVKTVVYKAIDKFLVLHGLASKKVEEENRTHDIAAGLIEIMGAYYHHKGRMEQDKLDMLGRFFLADISENEEETLEITKETSAESIGISWS